MKKHNKTGNNIIELTLHFEPSKKAYEVETDALVEKIISIPPDLMYHRFNYSQVCRGKRSAVFHQMLDQKTVGYEVFIIHKEPDRTLYSKFYSAHERWPRDGDFGKTAWSCWTLEEAMDKFNSLEK